MAILKLENIFKLKFAEFVFKLGVTIASEVLPRLSTIMYLYENTSRTQRFKMFIGNVHHI